MTGILPADGGQQTVATDGERRSVDDIRPSGNSNWLMALKCHADRSPDSPAVEFAGQSRTYGEMWADVRRLAAGMQAQGLGRGDIVGVLGFNSYRYLLVVLASSYIGAVSMPTNFRLAVPEIAHLLGQTEPALFFCDSELSEGLSAAAERAGVQVRAVTMEGPPADGSVSMDELMTDDPDAALAVMAEHDMHRLVFTSGTTSYPKGAMISHGNIAWKNLVHACDFGYAAEDVGLICGPMYHVGAFDVTATSLLHVGGSLVLHRRFDAARVLAAIEAQHVTTIWLAPAMLQALLAHPDVERRDLSSVRLIVSGGEKVPEPLILKLLKVFPSAWFADAYGLTEGGSAVTVLQRSQTLAKRGSPGKPLLFVELAIMDPGGETVGPNVVGEIVMRSPAVFHGYWKDPESTRQAFRGGWLHTQDLGYLDDDGYLYVVDRLKDMIRSGSENIASLEVERALYEHPAVTEVAVVGRPHERWGEVPWAFVVSGEDLTEAELLDHCRERLAGYKVPKGVTFASELPRNASGKVLKRELRVEIAELGEMTGRPEAHRAEPIDRPV
ncbi:MAG: AMP-dependent synthetase and ligase [Blastococcus sp.]|nr:AMP-dependent synthetase and ligase [Blastococcus sp.]